jgi:hypothetical protein
MPPITASAEIKRSAAEAFDYTTDPTRFAEWQHGVVSGYMEKTGNNAPERCITVRKIGFTERASTAELVRHDPPRAWSVHGIDGPIRAMVDVDVVPLADEQCRVTIAVDFKGHGIGRLLVPLAVRRQAHKEMPVNLANLKQQLEQPSPPA